MHERGPCISFTLRRLIFEEINFPKIDFRMELFSRMQILVHFAWNLFLRMVKLNNFAWTCFCGARYVVFMYDNDREKRNFFKISEDVVTAALPSTILIRNSNCFEIESYSFKN